ncbi:transglutaminase-like domain-containing protein [Paenibacillus typhae]|uniref:Transglutaminase-like superfamily protein n=1 Tax=Paenibacillus typhae TaxID=1174501 RepID=A0A1G8GAI6_9BACL|nr:transglutaminase-like domain-containing protein [Paenibacillus typhae]SDH91394.1 Transglutaminase-like superfamily protein [Paenibacillus typhae]
MTVLITETKLMNYSHPGIQQLLRDRQWALLPVKEQILQIYNFVRDEIKFGYNRADVIQASEILQDGYGQCNTKGILFMTLLSAVGIPCRMHGFTIDKELQKGAMKGWYYRLSPQEIIHSWVEVWYKDKWLNIEGFILDIAYLSRLQDKFADCPEGFCGYGAATNNLSNPEVYWDEGNTYIQKEGIVQDFGIFDSPDDFFAVHRQKFGPLREAVFVYIVRHLMNRNVSKIRQGTAATGA